MSTIILLENASSENENKIVFMYPTDEDRATLTIPESFKTEFNTNGNESYKKNFLAEAYINSENKDDSVIELQLTENKIYKFIVKDKASTRVIRFRDELKEYLKNTYESSIPEIRQICHEIESFIIQILVLIKELNSNLTLGINDNDSIYDDIKVEGFLKQFETQIPLYALIYSKYIEQPSKYHTQKIINETDEENLLEIRDEYEEKLYTIYDDNINYVSIDHYRIVDSIGGKYDFLKFTSDFLDNLKSLFLSGIIIKIARKTQNGDNGNGGGGSGTMTQQEIINILKDACVLNNPDFKNFKEQNEIDLNRKAESARVTYIEEDIKRINKKLGSFATNETIDDIKTRLSEYDVDGKLNYETFTITNYAKTTYVNDKLSKKADIDELNKKQNIDDCFLKKETYNKECIDKKFKDITEAMKLLATQQHIDGILETIENIQTNIQTIKDDITKHDTRITILEKDHVTLANFQELQGIIAGHTTQITNIQNNIGTLGDLEAVNKLTSFFTRRGADNKLIIDAYTATTIESNFLSIKDFNKFQNNEFKTVDKRSQDNKERLDALPDFTLLPKDLGDITFLTNALVKRDSISNDRILDTYTKGGSDNKFHTISDFNDFINDKYNITAILSTYNKNRIDKIEAQLLKITNIDDLAKKSELQTIGIININGNIIESNVYQKKETYSKIDADETFAFKNDVYDINAINDMFEKLPDFNGISNINELVSKNELEAEQIVTVNAITKKITTNVYTKKYIDDNFALKTDVEKLEDIVDNLDISGPLAEYAKIQSLKDAEFLTLGATSIDKNTRNVYTKDEADKKFILDPDKIEELITNITNNLITNQITNITNGIVGDYVKIQSLKDANFITGATITDATRNVYTKSETYSKDDIDDKISGIGDQITTITGNITNITNEISGEYVKVSVFNPVSAQVTTNKNDISDLKDKITSLQTGIIDTNAIQNLINSSLNKYVLITTFNLVKKQVDKNTSAIEELEGKINNLDISGSLKDYAKIQSLKDANFITGATITDATRNVYTKSETYSKNEIDSKISGIEDEITNITNGISGEYVTIKTFELLEGRVKKNEDSISDLQNKIKDLDITALQNIINSLQGINVSSFITKDTLKNIEIININGNTITSNVYTKLEVDNLISANKPTIDAGDIQDIVIGSLKDYAKIQSLTDAEFLTSGATSINKNTRNVYTKSETYSKDDIDDKISGIGDQITTITGNITNITNGISGEYVKVSVFNPVSAQVTTNKNDISDLKDKINSIDTTVSNIDVSKFALKTEVYKKSETYSASEADGRFALKTSIPDTTIFALKSDAYTKSESDDRFAPKGSIPDISSFASKNDLNTIVTAIKDFTKNETNEIQYLICLINDLLLDKPLGNCVKNK